MKIDTQELKTECLNDPKKMGLTAHWENGENDLIVAALNAKDGPGAEPVALTTITKNDALLGLAPAALALTDKSEQLQKKWDRLLNLLQAADQQVNVSRLTGYFQAAIADGLMTQEHIDAFASRPGSRAEVLWGAGASVTLDDVRAAHSLEEV